MNKKNDFLKNLPRLQILEPASDKGLAFVRDLLVTAYNNGLPLGQLATISEREGTSIKVV